MEWDLGRGVSLLFPRLRILANWRVTENRRVWPIEPEAVALDARVRSLGVKCGWALYAAFYLEDGFARSLNHRVIGGASGG